ncbi:MAG: hypothetical protein M9921_04980 [Fimbriimonadaceae bacterium]|nr:hypothetical protein [Fimbriimonadaceae bacterium]
MTTQNPLHYLPLLTTAVSLGFFVVLVRAAQVRRSGPHLMWWAIGALCYGLGTGIESAITLTGNSVELTKMWYVAGALLGGYPLAQGTAYLLLKRRTANILSYATLAFVAVAAILVIASPVNLAALEPTRPSGAILAWRWVRLLTPLINGYAAVLLIGGAVLSAKRYAQIEGGRSRAIGNALIAAGALLPGIGGGFAKAGHVEVLYVGECIGLLLIWAGYQTMVQARHPSPVPPAGAAKA